MAVRRDVVPFPLRGWEWGEKEECPPIAPTFILPAREDMIGVRRLPSLGGAALSSVLGRAPLPELDLGRDGGCRRSSGALPPADRIEGVDALERFPVERRFVPPEIGQGQLVERPAPFLALADDSSNDFVGRPEGDAYPRDRPRGRWPS